MLRPRVPVSGQKIISVIIEISIDLPDISISLKYEKARSRGGSGCARPGQPSRRLSPAGPGGAGRHAGGDVAAALKIAPNTLTFHFDRLRDAGLVTVRRDGRSMIYAAQYDNERAARLPDRELLPGPRRGVRAGGVQAPKRRARQKERV